MKKKYFLITIFIVILIFLTSPFWARLEGIFHDFRAELFIRSTSVSNVEKGVSVETTNPNDYSERFVIVDIDDYSLSKLGKWPWNRSVYVDFLKKVERMKPKFIFFDIYFPEKSEYDRKFGESVKKYGNVGFVYNFRTDISVPLDEKTKRNLDRWSFSTDRIGYFEPIIKSILPTISPISDYAFLGHDWMVKDKDSVFRTIPEYVIYKKRVYLSIPVVVYMKDKNIPIDALRLEGNNLKVADLEIPLDGKGMRYVDYYSSSHSGIKFRHISFYDLLSGEVQMDLSNKFIFVGMSAKGLATAAQDIKLTPVGDMPGIEYLLNATINIFEHHFIYVAPFWFNLLFVLLGAFIITFIEYKYNGWKVLYFSFFMFSAYIILALVSYKIGFYIEMSRILASIVLTYLVLTFYKYIKGEQEKRFIRDMFSSYVSEQVVNQLIKHPELATLQGDKRDMSVLFSDIRSFTTYSETHKSEVVVERLNEYLQAMTDVIMDNGGTLDKFVGDEIMALFGAPVYYENNADVAVKTALAMRKRLYELWGKWKAEGKDLLDMGVGINSGEMIVGNIGAKKKMDYTVIGDNVNLGARVEALTRVYNVGIIITEFTYKKLQEYKKFCREIDVVKVKGKNEPTKLYEVMEEKYSEAVLFNFTEALKLYKNQEWDIAEKLFKDVLNMVDDPVSRLFLERIAYFRKNPPGAEWDGVFVMKEK